MITTRLRDDFNVPADDVNRLVWTTPEGNAAFFGRTAIRNPNSTSDGRGRIVVSDDVAHLTLSTFNPTARVPGDSVWGSEIDSRETFALGNGVQGLEFAARVRSPAEMPPGIVTALFGWGDRPFGLHDEIDWEFASNLYRGGSSPPQALLNRYANEGPGEGHPIQITMDPGFDFTAFHTFGIRYFPGRIEWLVDGVVAQVATTSVPTGPLGVRLNIWAPAQAFAVAYSPELQPVASAAANVDYDYQVDWVQVQSTTTNFGDTVRSRVSYTLPSDVLNVVLEGTGAIDAIGNALPNTLTGNAGRNVLTGGPGDDTLSGGDGVDSAAFSGARSAYAGARNGEGVIISGPEGVDALSGIERLQFANASLALDLGSGEAAANTVRLIGAAFGKAHVAPQLVGTGIDLFDGGLTLQQVAQLALDTPLYLSLAGSRTNVDFVNTVYRNVVGTLPSAAERDFFVGMLQGSGGTQTQAELLAFAATTSQNETNIDLVGLRQSGVEFL